MTKENLTKLISFKTLYLTLLTFVVLHLVLLVFGLSFTPILWNSWFFILCLTFLIHPWRIFYRTRDFQAVPINIDYRIEDKEIIIARGFLARTTYDHHELINPFIMKSEVKYRDE